ncbi:DUF2269 family protein [Woodsholea maritima]|uniref:DUF2269 family protein n=1 Tax=Woodsholea maritima TaxID=240237 RepID=UPI0003680713|nr:DUF2269 family protein [Woodsholea maritima]
MSLADGFFLFFAALSWGGSAATGTMLALANGTRDARDLAITSDLAFRTNLFLNTPALLGCAPFLAVKLTGSGARIALEPGPLALGLYLGVIIFWIWQMGLQARIRFESQRARAAHERLSGRYYRLYAIGYILGFPGFVIMPVIIGLTLWV